MLFAEGISRDVCAFHQKKKFVADRYNTHGAKLQVEGVSNDDKRPMFPGIYSFYRRENTSGNVYLTVALFCRKKIYSQLGQ